MRKNILVIIASLALVALFATSCFNKEKGIKFDNLAIKEQVYLFADNDTTKPFANVEIDFTYPKNYKSKEDLLKLQKIFIGTFFNDMSYDSLSPKEALNAYFDKYTNDYRDLGNQYYEDISNLEGDNPPSWYWYQLFKSNKILIDYQ